MSEKKQHINYSQADIDRYLSGQMPPAEMHALEQAAHQDAFLADAIEGFRNSDMDRAAADLDDIRGALLKTKKTAPETVPLTTARRYRWWQVAAMLLLIAGASIVGWYTLQPRGIHKEELAKNTLQQTDSVKPLPLPPIRPQDLQAAIRPKTRASVSLPPPPPPPAVTADATVPRDVESLADRLRKTDSSDNEKMAYLRSQAMLNEQRARMATRSVTSLGKTSELSVSGTIAMESVTGTQTVAAQPVIAATGQLSSITVTSSANAAERPVFQSADQVLSGNNAGLVIGKKIDPALHQYLGVVLDANRVPIPYASITIEKAATAVNADKNGRFKLTSMDTAPSVKVDALGFSSSKLQLAANQPNQITLLPSNQALEEVVVIGYGAKRRKFASGNAQPAREGTESIMPVNGWEAFNSYLAAALKMPLNRNRTLELELQFSNRGHIAACIVLNTWDAGLNPAVIDALKKGPRWLMASGKPAIGKKKIVVLL